MSWTTPSAIKYVKSQLGYPKRCLELDKDNFDQALKRAVSQYGTVKPVIRKSFIDIITGQQAYDFVALGKPYGKGLLTVYDEPITSPQSVFNEFEYYRLRQPPYVDMGELVTDQMYYKEIGYLTGTNFDWEWHQDPTTDPVTAMLLVTPRPTRSRKLAYDYNAGPSRIEEIPAVGQGWVVDYTLALVKEMLGRVRGKFGGSIPGTEFSIDNDASELLSEAKDEQERLREKLGESRGDWTPPIKA